MVTAAAVTARVTDLFAGAPRLQRVIVETHGCFVAAGRGGADFARRVALVSIEAVLRALFAGLSTRRTESARTESEGTITDAWAAHVDDNAVSRDARAESAAMAAVRSGVML